MAPTSRSARPSPADLARLEQAFAADSTEDAYHALGEAYLVLGRHLEAMVVCRKGMRSRPFSAKPHLLMARIQAAQGRKQKVHEALDAALDREGKSSDVLLVAAETFLAIEEKERAAELLRRALAEGAAEAAIRDIAEAHGVAWGEPTERPSEEAVPAATTPPRQAPVVSDKGEAPPRRREPDVEPAAGEGKRVQASTAAGGEATPVPSAPVGSARVPSAPQPLDPSAWDDEWDEATPRGRRGLLRLGLTAALMLAALVSWSAYSQWKGARDKEIASLLEEAIELQRKDTYAALQSAYEAAERAERLGAGGEAHAHLAYVAALRWVDHGDAAALRQAQAHLARAPKRAGGGGRRLAAEALIATGEGDPARAIALLEKALQDPAREGRGLLRTTLGRLFASQGRMEEATAVFRKAVGEGTRSPRLLASLGEAWHRQGRMEEARSAYDEALALDSEHLPSRIGKAMLLLDSDPPPVAEREALWARVEASLRPVRQASATSFSSRELALARQAAALLAFARGGEEEGAKLEEEAKALDPGSPALRHLQERRQARLSKKP